MSQRDDDGIAELHPDPRPVDAERIARLRQVGRIESDLFSYYVDQSVIQPTSITCSVDGTVKRLGAETAERRAGLLRRLAD